MSDVTSAGSGGFGYSRREVIKHTLSNGFALAVGAVAETALATSDEGIEAGEVKITTGDGTIPGYRALPLAAKTKLPILIVVHEIFGVHEHIKDVCRRFAKLGYYAIAPELFARVGDPQAITDIKELLEKIVSKAPDQRVLTDLDSTFAFAKRDKRTSADRFAITGFCWGGRIVWLYAAHQPALKAGVAWYGKLIGTKDPLHPRSPTDVVSELKAPVLGLYGGKDQGIPLATVEEFRLALAAAKSGKAGASSIKVYPEAGHAFFADYRPSYRKADAEDGLRELLAWFKAHGAR